MKTAMILAAGRGERLKPLTDRIPKPMCLVQGKPLIEHHVIRLAAAGFERIIVNHAHLGGQIRRYLGNGKSWGIKIDYLAEPPGALETGGALIQALPYLGSRPFVTVNADIFTDFDFSTLALDSIAWIHAILSPKNEELGHMGDFGLNAQGYLTLNPREYTFSGITCYHPESLKECRVGRFSITPLIRRYVTEQRVTGAVYSGLWQDVGSVVRLNSLNHILEI